MKTTNSILILCLFFLGLVTQAQNGLESIYVERYYVTDAIDAANSNPTVPVGAVTYRVYADMLPGYKVQTIFGIPAHPMTMTTTTYFFNQEDYGNSIPSFSSTNAKKNTVMIDSWLSTGGACNGWNGVPKTEDNGLNNFVNSNVPQLLQNNATQAGIPLTTQDGMLAGTVPTTGTLGIDQAMLDLFGDGSANGNTFLVPDGSWYCLTGAPGIIPSSNKVLIAQITTDGIFHFELNIQIGTPTGGTENYVHSNPTGVELTIPSLTQTLYPVPVPPTVSISNPAEGASFAIGNPISITADANDTDGTITKVEFFVDGSSVGIDFSSPYEASYTGLIEASHVLTAVATDNENQSTTSAAVNINIVNAPPTAFSVTGGGSYCQGSSGLPVGLTNSETGVTYTLFKDAVAQVPTVIGTGTAISFGNQLSGTYTVSGSSTAGTVAMTGNAVITETLLPVPTITGANSLCVGSTGNVYSTEAGNTNYVWSVSAGGTITSGGTASDNTVTVSWNTAGSQSVSVNYTNAGLCTSSAPTAYAVAVNALPVATISGLSSVCLNSTGNVYSTEVGMTAYAWTVSAGGTITAGGTATDNSVTVTWNTAGAQTVSVNYTNVNSCTAAASTVYAVTVNVLPSPTVSGPAAACAASTGNVYTTEAGNSNYTWTVSAGGTITAGGTATDNTVTVTWNTAGAQSVSVNYSNSNFCSAATASVYTVTVNDFTVPVIAGVNSVCAGSTGNVYSTEAGNNNYVWSVSAGGTITSGGTATDNTVTVSWNTAGAQSVSVNYTNAGLCTASAPTVYAVAVNALPVPVVSGPSAVCLNTTGNVYSTLAGMTAYVWSVSAGGSITAGGTASDNSVTVTWNTAGAQTVSVNYTNANSCTAAASTVYAVTLNALPSPTVSGLAAACAASTGNVYTTEAGNSNYTWTVSAGGTITAGGTAADNTVTITWNTAGAQTVSVNYSNANSCAAATASVYNVTVNTFTVPVITGANSVCAGSTGSVYSTEAGNTNYIWSVSAGGTITSGGTATDNTVTISWNSAGSQSVSVNYTNAGLCTASAPTAYAVAVNALPVATISGLSSVCLNSTGNVYSTEVGMTAYAWTVSAGGTITAGGTATDNSIIVTWNTAGAQTVSVNYTNANSCTAAASTVYAVTLNALPSPTVSGLAAACAASTGNVYTTEAGNSNYTWTVSAGGTITAGGTAADNTITITWNTAGAQTVSVNYSNANSCAAATASVYNVTVNTFTVPVITGANSVCAGSTGSVYSTEAGNTNYIWSVSAGGTITSGGTATDNTVTISWNTAGAQSVSVNYTNTTSCSSPLPVSFSVVVNANIQPVINGASTVSLGSTETYSSDAGMTNYSWIVSPGGTIVAGGTTTSNTITIQWNGVGVQSVSVNYSNINGCNSPTPTVLQISVLSLPPAAGNISGLSEVCQGASGIVYSIAAIPNATGYVWSLPLGAIIATGNNTNSITVNYSSTATSGIISVYGTNTFGNGNPSPDFAVNVNQLPEPVITGLSTVCVSASATGYSTQAGNIYYTWTVSSGGTITSGIGTNSITVIWNTPGANSVTVNYTNPSGCSGTAPATFNVNVESVPVPTIQGPVEVCAGTNGAVYVTEPGFQNYIWIVSYGGVITAGLNTNQITVDWGNAGQRNVTVNYQNSAGCSALSPTIYNVTVLTAPAPTITGNETVCEQDENVSYTTQVNFNGYEWNVSSGGTITSGIGTNEITVTWNTNGNQSVSVSYTNDLGCAPAEPSVFNVSVSPKPSAAGIIMGSSSLCAGSQSVVYSVALIPDATSYSWSLPTGASIVSGANTNTITVDFASNASSGIIDVYGVNDCGSGESSPNLNVVVNPVPATPVISNNGDTLVSSALSGNQWYIDGVEIPGATGKEHIAVFTGTYTVIVSLNGCSSDVSNGILILPVSTNEISIEKTFEVYPNPNNGVFDIKASSAQSIKCTIEIYSNVGALILKQENALIDGSYLQHFELEQIPAGSYVVVLRNKDFQILRKVIIMK